MGFDYMNLLQKKDYVEFKVKAEIVNKKTDDTVLIVEEHEKKHYFYLQIPIISKNKHFRIHRLSMRILYLYCLY